MKQDRPRIYDVTLQRVCLKVVAVENQRVFKIMFVCIVALFVRHANNISSTLYAVT